MYSEDLCPLNNRQFMQALLIVPYSLVLMTLYALSMFFLLLVSVVFWGGGERYEWCLDGVVVWGR